MLSGLVLSRKIDQLVASLSYTRRACSSSHLLYPDTGAGSSNLPIRTGHPQFELQEGQLDDLEGVPKEGVEDAVGVGGIEGREVGGSEAAVVESIALVHHTVAACRHATETDVSLVHDQAHAIQTIHQHTSTAKETPRKAKVLQHQ